MNLVDVVAVVYVLWGYRFGVNRGAGKEMYRLINTAVVLVSGAGLYKWVSGLLGHFPILGEKDAGLVGFILPAAGALFILGLVRKRLRIALEYRFRDTAPGLGGIIGAVRAFTFVLILMTAAILSPVEILNTWFGEGSFLGRLIVLALPGQGG